MAIEIQKTGIDVVGDMVAWGALFCLFYETKADLLDTLISYCKSGLERGEYCLWIVAEPLTIAEARAALQDAVPDLDRHLADARLELASARDWFLQGGVARAPWISSLRTELSPRLLIPNKRVCPPVECCLGTNPHQAANCRPLVKPPTSPTAAINAVAVRGPMPGIGNRRWLSGCVVASTWSFSS